MKYKKEFALIFGLVAGASVLGFVLPRCRGAQSAKTDTRMWISGPSAELLKVNRSPDGRICVPLKVNGKEYNFYVDTGASTTLHSAIARKLSIHTSDSGVSSVDPLGHTQELLVANATLDLGKFKVVNAQLIVTDLSGLRQINMQQKLPVLDGILGSDILELLKAKIDFSANTIELRRPSDGTEAGRRAGS